MNATPLWLALLTVVVGPAVTAAALTLIGQKALQKQKGALDNSLAEHKAVLDEAAAGRQAQLQATLNQRLAEHKAALDEAAAGRQAQLQATLSRRLAEQKAGLEETWRGWRDLETWVLDYSMDLRRAYALVFDDGASATADELAALVRQAQDLVVTPYRRRERLLARDTGPAILNVNAHLGQFLLGSAPATPEKVARFRATRQDFFTMVGRARHTIHDELARRDPRHDR